MVRHGRLGAPKLNERERAIDLRRKGLTYSEILRQVPVAKSTLSVWLGEVGLTAKQKQRISDKKRAAMLRGSASRRATRVARTQDIRAVSALEVVMYMRDPLFVSGVSLYWAEGSKQKESNVSQPVAFSNMDVRAHAVFLRWIEKYARISRAECVYQVYVPDTLRAATAVAYWRENLKIPLERVRIYSKKPGGKTSHHIARNDYYGILRVVVPRSTDLNRRIGGWIDGVVKCVE